MLTYLLLYLLIINLVAFCATWRDKTLAQARRMRISEKTLFILAFLGGSVGEYLAMQIFRHKTKKARFFIGIPLIFVLQAVLLFWLLQKFRT